MKARIAIVEFVTGNGSWVEKYDLPGEWQQHDAGTRFRDFVFLLRNEYTNRTHIKRTGLLRWRIRIYGKPNRVTHGT